MTDETARLMALARENEHLRAVNAELLAALKEINRVIDVRAVLGAHSVHKGLDAAIDPDDYAPSDPIPAGHERIAQIVRAAIARATKEG